MIGSRLLVRQCRNSLPLKSLSSKRAFGLSVQNKSQLPSSEQEHQAEASKWLQAVPGHDEQSKGQNVIFGTALTSLLLGKEILPYTVDVVYTIPFTLAMYLVFKHASPLIGDLVQQVMNEDDKIWADSKAKAEVRLEQDIHQITGSGITDLEQLTADIFANAKHVAQLEADAYEHSQKVQFFTKAKGVLDEWVRYEAAEREKEQKRIADEVIARVMAAIQDPGFEKQYLEQCIGDVESALAKN